MRTTFEYHPQSRRKRADGYAAKAELSRAARIEAMNNNDMEAAERAALHELVWLGAVAKLAGEIVVRGQ